MELCKQFNWPKWYHLFKHKETPGHSSQRRRILFEDIPVEANWAVQKASGISSLLPVEPEPLKRHAV